MFAKHFAKGGTLEDFDLKSSKKVYEEELKKGKDVVATEVKPKEDTTEDLVTKLKKLADLRDAGVLSDEEFQQLKGKLIAQM
jgi:hypothetical protein